MNRGSAESPDERLGRLGGQIAVEQAVGGAPHAALLEVHQEEGEIVEHVAAGDRVGKLDRVEQDGLAADDRDVAQMQVAMAAPDVAVAPASEQRRPRHREGEARFARQAGRLPGREQLRPLGEGGVVLLDIGLELVSGARPVAQRRARVGAANGLRPAGR